MAATADGGDSWLVSGIYSHTMPSLSSLNGRICYTDFAPRILYTYTPDYAAAIVGKIDTSPKKRL